MDATTAMGRTQPIVTGVVDGLTPEHREMPTPCDEWTVHELIEHMCQGGQMIAGGLRDQAPPDETPDYLAEGPVAGWADAAATLEAAATPEALAASHELPFGEVPGEVALSVITADHLTHAVDLARATGQEVEIDDELAEWALQTWQVVVPAEGRTGDGFAAVVPVPDDAPAVDRLLGYTGRQP
jgi:uncharacterized protein (TIGR03086 family)